MDIFKSFCELTIFGYTKHSGSISKNIPLHKCDLYGSKKVGKHLT